MKTLRNYWPGLQQALYDKHTLLQLAEELNKKHLINIDAFVTVQAKDSREGSKSFRDGSCSGTRYIWRGCYYYEKHTLFENRIQRRWKEIPSRHSHLKR